jgi:hypothetical protein
MSHKLQVKQVDLSNVPQDNTKVKFLVIDSAGNVYWNDDVDGTGGTYTNADPVPVQLGGINAGDTFNEVSMQQMWTSLLYPYLTPAFAIFTVSGGTPLEVGADLPATLTFTWDSSQDPNVVPNSITITDTTGTILSGQPADGSNTYTYAVPVGRTTVGAYDWTIRGLNTSGGSYIANTYKYWYWKIYWGASASTASPTESFVKGLSNELLSGSRVGTYSFAANNYKYLAIPVAYGVPTSINYNGLPFALADSANGYTLGSGNITYTSVSITNDNGQTETYNVFRSKNPLVGLVSMLVS